MKTRKRLALALSLAAVVAVGTFVAAGRMPAGAQGPKPKADEQPATGRRAEYIAAFNRGDARAVAAFWTEDATYVDQAGRAYEGRAAIEKLFEQGFAARKGATLAIHVTSSKVLSPDVALEDGITEVTPPGGGLAAVARFSAVLVRRDGQWYVQSIRESVAHPPSNAEHLEGLAWLIGEWEGEAEKGESARAWYEWAENENFIVSSYATTLDGEPVVGGTQWIG
ncbi:MAG TPA: SgcJ/EcaC family oxidoreductase, partial [Gemmataceae bacterium]